MDAEGAHIIDDNVREQLSRKNISPSLVTGLEGCHARWLADQYVVREIVKEEPDNAAIRGSLYHKVMEELFALPAGERTTDKVKELLNQTINLPEFVTLKQYPEAISWIKKAINGYYSMGGKPEQVKIATLTLNEKDGPKSGIELFVKDKVGNASRPTLGFIDQIVEDPTRDDGSVVINDWKTGSKAKQYKPKNKYEEGLAEQRQQILYTEILRSHGVKVSGARLVFPIARQVVKVDLASAELRERAISDVEKADEKLDRLLETNSFKYSPGILCAWCPLAKCCPKADIKPIEKAKVAFSTQPGIELLDLAIEFAS